MRIILCNFSQLGYNINNNDYNLFGLFSMRIEFGKEGLCKNDGLLSLTTAKKKFS